MRIGGRTFVPGQGNNAYIFPGVGLGVVVSGALHVTDEMFAAAARTLASLTTQASLDAGTLFPPLTEIRQVSHAIAVEVARIAFGTGLATVEEPADLAVHLRRAMYEPEYPTYE